MMRIFLGVALLSVSWLLGQHYYYPAQPLAWVAVVLTGTMLLGGTIRRRVPRRETWTALVLLVPAVGFAPWPDRAAPLLLAVGLIVRLLPIPRHWPRSLGQGALAAGAVLSVQALVMALYTGCTARCHELPWPLPQALAGVARLLGIEAAADGSTLVMHSIRQPHRFGATWELLVDPATLCFFVGSALMLGILAWGRLARGQRRTGWLKMLLALTLVVIAWLPIRAAVLLAVYINRVLLADYELPLHVMNLFLSPWIHLLLLLGPVLLAWRFVQLPTREPGASSPKKTVKPWQYPAAALLVAAGVVLLTVAVRWDPVGAAKAGRVMVVERHSEWEPTVKPYDTTWYGHDSGYNYAAAYAYCGQYFAMSRLLESDPINNETLSQCDVLVIKVPTARYSREEVEAVLKFVRGGGGLLLVGDHTNVFKCGTYLNDIARPMGFIFRDDLLFGTGESPYDQHYRRPRVPHPIVQHLPPMDLAVSCSIDPGRSRGRAAILGTGLFSLPPDYHLENYHTVPQLRPDMRYGAFVQLWSTRHGRGRVLAFTDSTIFSSFCVFQPGKAELLRGMVDWLNHNNRLGDPRPWLLMLGLVVLLAGLWLTRGWDRAWLVLPATAWFAWTLACLSVVAVHRGSMPVPKLERPMARVVVDRTISKVPLAKGAFIEGNWDGFGLLEQWISRLATPQGKCYAMRADGSEAFSGEALVIVHPSRPVTDEFRRRVIDYVADGGKLLVIDSPENGASTANSLLWPFGLSMLHGQVIPAQALTLTDDWPDIDSERAYAVEGGRPIARLGETAVGAVAQYEKGSVMAIGFGAMFNDGNLGYRGERALWALQPPADMLFESDNYVRYNVWFALLRGLLAGEPPAAEYTARVAFDRTVSEVALPKPEDPKPDATEYPDDGFAFFEMWAAYLGYATSRAGESEPLDADALVVLLPSREVEPSWRDRLVQYVDQGGKLLVIDSPENNNSTANELLKPFGLSIDHNAPRAGTLGIDREEGGPWPNIPVEASCPVEGGEPFAVVGEIPVGATARHGKGTVMAVGFGPLLTTASMRASWSPPEGSKELVPYNLATTLLRALLTDQPPTKTLPSVPD